LRHRVAIRFAVTGDLRFLSHRDMLRLFERAVRRANLPIRYTQGFNPRPRLWLPLPRPVGVESDDELLIVELTGSQDPAGVYGRLAGQLPTSIGLREAFVLTSQTMPRPVEATYSIGLCEPPGAELVAAVRRILTAEQIRICRVSRKGNPPRWIDVRGGIVRIDVTRDAVTFTLRTGPTGSVRPAEVLEQLGLSPAEAPVRVRRVAVRWEGLQAEQPNERFPA